MFPSFLLFGREIGLYAIMLLCGLFTAGIYACILAHKRKDDYVDLIRLILFIFIGVFLGGHLLYALVNYKEAIYFFNNINRIESFPMLVASLQMVIGGNIFYGGLIGGLIAGYITTRKIKKYAIFTDIIAVCIPLFHFFGRIGCFLGGCCFGIHSEVGFTFLNCPIPEANGISRFPVQLLEASFNLALFFALNLLYKKNKFKDELLFVYLFIYAIARFFIEFLRGDLYRGIWGFLSTSQIISIIIILFVLINRFIYHRRKQI